MWEMYVIYNKKNLIAEIQLIRFLIVTATGSYIMKLDKTL
jgi:hypothetical protein